MKISHKGVDTTLLLLSLKIPKYQYNSQLYRKKKIIIQLISLSLFSTTKDMTPVRRLVLSDSGTCLARGKLTLWRYTFWPACFSSDTLLSPRSLRFLRRFHLRPVRVMPVSAHDHISEFLELFTM